MFKNQKGFGLAQVLVSVGIMSILAAVFAMQMQQMNTALATADAKMGLQSLVLDMKAILSKAAVCQVALQGNTSLPTSGSSSISIRLSPTAIASTGAELKNYYVEVEKLELRNVSTLGFTVGGQQVISGAIVLTPTLLKGNPHVSERSIGPLFAVLNGSGGVVSCGAEVSEVGPPDPPPPPPAPPIPPAVVTGGTGSGSSGSGVGGLRMCETQWGSSYSGFDTNCSTSCCSASEATIGCVTQTRSNVMPATESLPAVDMGPTCKRDCFCVPL